MLIKSLLEKLHTTPDEVEFTEVMESIAKHYRYTPTRFTNGDTVNEAGVNEGSCKIFAFARMHQLDEAQTLACFGRFYRNEVLKHPDDSNHVNIRTFMKSGWAGIHFDGQALESTD